MALGGGYYSPSLYVLRGSVLTSSTDKGQITIKICRERRMSRKVGREERGRERGRERVSEGTEMNKNLY